MFCYSCVGALGGPVLCQARIHPIRRTATMPARMPTERAVAPSWPEILVTT